MRGTERIGERRHQSVERRACEAVADTEKDLANIKVTSGGGVLEVGKGGLPPLFKSE